MPMDTLDKEILNEIQWTFPLIPQPYVEMAKKFKISEDELMQRLVGLKKTRLLPTLKLFKIGVKLDMIEDKAAEVKPIEEKKKILDVKFVATEKDKEYIRELQKDLEIVKRPFLKSAQKLGITEEQLLEKTKYYEEIGVMRRFAAIL